MNNSDVTEFLKRYDGEWLDKFLFGAFGKHRYAHVLSEHGLDCYLSNLRSVSESSPDDIGCVAFYVTIKHSNGMKTTNLYNIVDFKDPDIFINTFKKYLELKAFL